MNAALSVACGLLAGILGALPMLWAFELALRGARTPSMTVGLASVFVTFVALMAFVATAWVLVPTSVMPFGLGEAASFLLVWVIEAWKAWRDAQGGAVPGERNRGESARQP